MKPQKKQKKEQAIPKKETMGALLQKQLQESTKRASEFKNKYMAALADAENMRKRLQKEKQDYMDFAKRDLLRDLLLPLDQFENALQHADKMSDEIKNWAFGFQMILNQIQEILTQNKVRSFETVGHTFDPKLHEAIELVESDEKPGIVLEQCAKGYMIGDALLRPAQVKVAKAKNGQEATKNQTIKEK